MSTAPAAALLRGALPPTVALAGLSMLVGWWVAGTPGLLGALGGAGVVLVFFGLGLLAVAFVRRADPVVMLLVALGSYAVRVVAFGVGVAVADSSAAINGQLNRTVFGLTAVGCALTWVVGEIVAFVRLRQPVFEPGGRS